MKILIGLKKACFCLIFIFLIILKFNAKAETIIVNNNKGSPVAGDTTLHGAIDSANSDPGKDTIVFNLTPEDKEIKLTTPLPDIDEPVTFLGKTYNDTTVLLNDSTSGSGVTGLQFLAGSNYSQVQGMSFQGFETAIHIQNTSNITLTDNNIGAIVRGNDPNHIDSARISNRGIHIESSDSITIGGDHMTKGNTITNCSNAGIYINSIDSCYIYGNKIGKSTMNLSDTSVTNSTGIEVVNGVSTAKSKIGSRTNNNLGNVISGNTNEGIKIVTSGSTINIIIANNYIGTDRQAMKKIGNENGISLIDNSFALGTKYNIFNNIIAYNQNNGIDIRDFSILSNISENSFYCNGSEAITGDGTSSTPVINKAGKDRISGTEFSETIIDTIEVYYEDTTCSGGGPQGQHFLGKTISNNGDWQLNGNFTIGKKIVALLIDDAPKTSQFTDPVCIKEPVSAGPDQFIYIDSTTIQASEFNEDSTGNWQFDTSNTGVSIQNMDSLNTLVKNIPDDTVINVKWCNQDTGICKSCDSLNITHLDGTPPASAKVNNKTREICSKGGIDSIMVSGNHPPKEDTGKWEIIKNSESAKIKKTGSFRNYTIKVIFNKADTIELSYKWGGTADTMTIINQNGLKVVDNSEFGGCGTLENALKIANNDPEPDTISFGKGAKEFSLDFYYPDIEEPLLIDGYSHPDFKTDTPAVKIKSEGSGYPLQINADNVIIRGLNFIEPDNRPYISSYNENLSIVNNYFGYDPENDTIYNNKESGIDLGSANSLIRGNTIAGITEDAGISNDGLENSGNVIENNVVFRNNTGIRLDNSSGNLITKNTFYCNRFKGIDLISGANSDHASPTITDISNTQIKGTAVAEDSVELYYADTLCNTKQGKNYFATVKADNSGNWQYNGSLSTLKVVALGYDTLGNTSEFSTSPCIAKKPSSVIEGKDFAEIRPADSTGKWENIDNTGKLFTIDSSKTAYHVNLKPGEKRLVWHDSLTKCPNQVVDTDTVSYNISSSNSTGVDAGDDVSVCFTDTADITGGSFGTLQWIPLTKGLTFSDSTMNNTTVYNLNKGPNYIIYNKETYDPALGKNVFKPDLKIVYRVDDSLKVSSVNDAGCGSLRNAVDFAEKQPSKDTITFASKLHSDLIILDSLIAIDSSYTVINGDIDNNKTPDIQILHNNFDTLFNISGNHNTIKNLNVRNAYTGFKVKGRNNKFIGNYIGTFLQGSAPSTPKMQNGIVVDTSQNIIGNGTKKGANRIARCNKTGILINSDSNTVDKNYIGGIITGSEKLDFGNTVGIKIKGDHNKIFHNDITENGYETSGKYGIGIIGGDHNKLEKNTISQNDDNGIFVDSGSNEQAIKNQFYKNSIFDHFDAGINIAEGNQQNVTPPVVDTIKNDTIYGSSPSNNELIQIYADLKDEGFYFLDSVRTNMKGKWKKPFTNDSIPQGLYNITALRDSNANTSAFSKPKSWLEAKTAKDTTICESFTQLKAEKPPENIHKKWVYVGSASFVPFILNDTSHVTGVKSLKKGENPFVWVLSKDDFNPVSKNPDLSGDNIISYDTLTITYPKPTTAALLKKSGKKKVITCDDSYLINLDSLNYDSISTNETTEWQFIKGGGTINKISNDSAEVSNLSTGMNKLKLTITDSSGTCKSIDSLAIEYNKKPVTNKDTFCVKQGETSSLDVISSYESNNNSPLKLTEIINNNPIRDTAFISDLSINYRSVNTKNKTDTLSYRICNKKCSECILDTAFITITKIPQIDAGNDTTVCFRQDTLSAVDTATGWTGSWTSLGEADIEDTSKAKTAVDSLQAGANKFVWKLTINGKKNLSIKDTITIQYFNTKAKILSGDTNICDNSMLTLHADSINSFEEGKWSAKYPAVSTISSPDSISTKITGFSENLLNTFYWTVKDTAEICSKTDSVQVKFNNSPVTQKDTFNIPANVTRSLQVFTKSEKKNNTPLMINNILNTNSLRDTNYIENKAIVYRSVNVSNAKDTLIYQVCDSLCNSKCTTDTAYINITDQVPDINAGNDTIVCSPQATISAIDTADGWIGEWSSIDNATITDSSQATTTVKDLKEVKNRFKWTLTSKNISGLSVFDTVTVYYYNPVADIKQSDSTICKGKPVLTTKALDNFENGNWTSNNSDSINIKSPNNDTTEVEGLVENNLNTFYWNVTDTSGACSDKDSVSIAFSSAGEINHGRDTVVVNDTLNLDVIYRKKLLEGDTVKISPEKTPEKGEWVFGPRNKSFQYFPKPENLGNDTLRFIVNKNSCPADINRYIITIQNAPPTVTKEEKDTSNANLVINIADINKNFTFIKNTSFIITKPKNANEQGISISNSGDSLVTIDYSNYTNPENKDSLEIEYKVCDAKNSCVSSSSRIALAKPKGKPKSKKALPLEVYNAVSPNNDGKQDFLKIKNIGFYNNNGSVEVIIFNRWGAEVYRSTNYLNNTSNAFTGRTNDDKELPGGTYYYHITVSYKGNTKRLSGYLELKRE